MTFLVEGISKLLITWIISKYLSTIANKYQTKLNMENINIKLGSVFNTLRTLLNSQHSCLISHESVRGVAKSLLLVDLLQHGMVVMCALVMVRRHQ